MQRCAAGPCLPVGEHQTPPTPPRILAGAHCPCSGQLVSELFRHGGLEHYPFFSLWYPEGPLTSPGWSQLPRRALPWGSAEAEDPQPTARTKISPLLPGTDTERPRGDLTYAKTIHLLHLQIKLVSAPAPPACQDPGEAVQFSFVHVLTPTWVIFVIAIIHPFRQRKHIVTTSTDFNHVILETRAQASLEKGTGSCLDVG